MAALPRAWTPEFALVPVEAAQKISSSVHLTSVLAKEDAQRIRGLCGTSSRIIVRSSVVGESIWERGTFCSVLVDCSSRQFDSSLNDAARRVVESADGRDVGLLIQHYVQGEQRGEFGNLYRISKSRDHWELNTISDLGSRTIRRLNCQRDQAASPINSLRVQIGHGRERLFGSIGAWLNNELLLGRRQRLNCEWVADSGRYYIVQIDEEDEDVRGVNPFQVRIPHTIDPGGVSGTYLQRVDARSITEWDKLKVLNDLWEPDAADKPTFFVVRPSDLPDPVDEIGRDTLARDFCNLIGRSGIIVRTSGKAGCDKEVNLPHTEGLLCPMAAARWCLKKAKELSSGWQLDNLAFVAHRFVAARASAWVRADPSSAMVEIHALWGLPDALQFCPYDIWEVHIPTEVATDYADYKSDMLIPQSDGRWEYVRVNPNVAINVVCHAAFSRYFKDLMVGIAVLFNLTCGESERQSKIDTRSCEIGDLPTIGYLITLESK